ncbi:hypothetical protein QRD90_22255 [Peribacillus frigoritolerans]|jgi:hypothetical protein|nr:hypothetical protein [Peribacillus frigoritolerans]KOR80454.1 hypothetical protein AM232_19845 [Bacillus sp. FJAT-21352]KOR85865.1 hypothetical protein AM233_18890 [Bacillus sp. FJAT-22058]AZV62732.1 hypothetical protein DOZ91_20830 [Peribacillus frigoritolerans]MDM5308310.1 hypothetical protein [Peribacillus frigoritolerans]USK79606.1 hypothetical protein LHV56_22700 [Peribacillus frigoritolerans]
MGYKIFSIIFILCGLFIMWFAIFGKKKEIKEIGIPTNFIDVILMMIYKLLPSIFRKILLFALGLAISIGFTYILFKL